LPHPGDPGVPARRGKSPRILLTSGKIDSKEAGKFGLVLKSVPDNTLNAEVETMTEQMSRAPINQLRLLKNLQKGRDGL
jgi:enoyl-CoA hydratase/carnithine racemase